MNKKPWLNRFTTFILSIPLAVVILLTPATGVTEDSTKNRNAPTAHREAYVFGAFYSFPGLIDFLAQDADFTKELTSAEEKQWRLLYSLFSEKVMEAQRSFPGGTIYELFNKIGLSYTFSDNPQDFILKDGKPERAAKTTQNWSDPIIFNRRMINSIEREPSFLDVISILFHEMGHKLGDKKNQDAIDSISAKMKDYLKRFYIIDVSSSGAKIEMLSLPSFFSEYSYGLFKSVTPLNLTTDLIFYSDSHKQTGLIKLTNSLDHQIHNLKRANSYGYNIMNNSSIRITNVKIYESMQPNPQIEFALDHIYKLGVLSQIKTSANSGSSELIQHPQIHSLINPESLRITLPYSFSAAGLHNDFIYWYSNNNMHLPTYDKRLSGIAKDIEISVDKSNKNKIIISVQSPLGAYKDYNVLGIKAFRNTLHLHPIKIKTMGQFEIKTYELPLSNQVPHTEFEVKYLVHHNFDDKMILSKQSHFTAGKGPVPVPSSMPYIDYLFYNSGQGWQSLPETGLTEIASLQPGIGLNLTSNMKVAEVKIIWKKVAEIKYKGQVAGNISGFETEVFTQKELIQTFHQDQTLLILKSKKFAIPYDPVSLIPHFEMKDNGFREIREIVVIGEDYSSYSHIARPFDSFDSKNGIQAPWEMINQVRRERELLQSQSTPSNPLLSRNYSKVACKKLFN